MRVFWTIAWKEWLGLRWKLAALCTILLGPVILCVFEFDVHELPVGVIIIAAAYIAVAPIFLAMHAAAEDSSSGTLEFVRGLPIPLARLGLVRILATLAVLVAPLVAAGALMYLLALVLPQWTPSLNLLAVSAGQSVGYIVLAMCVAASLFLWTTALAMNRPSELRAGLIGLVTAVVGGAWTLLSIGLWDNGPGYWNWMYGITALGPFGGAVVLDPGLSAVARVAIGVGQLAAMCVLTVIAARRYGILERTGDGRSLSPSSPNGALWWMQWRQAWPIGVAGLATMFALSLVGMALTSGGPRDGLSLFRSTLYVSSVYLGVVWAIVIAATLFSADLEPRLVAFWRSRPIDPGAWFRIKYLTGAIVLLAFIDLPALCAAALGRPLAISSAESLVSFLVCVPATHLAIYSMAVLIACLVRHTVYAGILSLGAALFVTVFPTLFPPSSSLSRLNVIWLMDDLSGSIAGARFESWLLSWANYLTLTLSLTAVATWLALRAVQKDIAVRA